jgi:hypothetical protein
MRSVGMKRGTTSVWYGVGADKKAADDFEKRIRFDVRGLRLALDSD